jgi:outer membrane protein assembly factor BamB
MQKPSLGLSLLLFGVMAIAGLPPAGGADWPHWRGPGRNGHSPESSGWKGGRWLPGRETWSAHVGVGCTSPVVAGGKVYVMGWEGGRDHVHCLDAGTGKELWKVSYRSPSYGRHHMGDEWFYSGPSSTPEYDAGTGYLYTLGIDGDLHCWDTRKRGRKVWHLNLYDRYRMPRRPKVTRTGSRRDYGYTTAPLVHGDWLLVEVGGNAGNLVALDKRTGKQRWASACKDLAGHTGGLTPLKVDGVPCVAVLTLTHLRVYRLDRGHEGETAAGYEWTTSFANNIPTPTAVGQEVLITSAYNKYSLCKLHISLKGARKVWQVEHPSKACSPVVHKGHVYLAWQRVRCLDLRTGKLQWQGGRFGDTGSCLVTADDRLVVFGNKGTLALVDTAEHSPGKYRELAKKDGLFRALAWPHVVLAEGRIYCKDRKGNLKCFAVRK